MLVLRRCPHAKSGRGPLVEHGEKTNYREDKLEEKRNKKRKQNKKNWEEKSGGRRERDRPI